MSLRPASGSLEQSLQLPVLPQIIQPIQLESNVDPWISLSVEGSRLILTSLASRCLVSLVSFRLSRIRAPDEHAKAQVVLTM